MNSILDLSKYREIRIHLIGPKRATQRIFLFVMDVHVLLDQKIKSNLENKTVQLAPSEQSRTNISYMEEIFLALPNICHRQRFATEIFKLTLFRLFMKAY